MAYAIISGIKPAHPHTYPVKRAKKVVGQRANPMMKIAEIQTRTNSNVEKPMKN
jgi:hypothetical protein